MDSRYLCGTSKMCLCIGLGKPVLIGYMDANMTNDMDSRKLVSSNLMTFPRGAISW